MVRIRAKFFTMAIILCVLIAITIATVVLNITNEPMLKSKNYTLTLDDAIKLLKKKFGNVFGCVEERGCDLYAIDIIMIAIPTRSCLYDVDIYVNGLNYTHGDAYRDTVVWRAALNKLSYHISMISYGIAQGYREWLDIEKRLGIHLDVGYGIYDRSRDRLWIYIDLPTFKFCEIAHACGEFYLNATLYIDKEKYIAYQFTKLNFSYLIDRGYIKIRKVEKSYAYPINPPAVIHFTYIETPFWRIPTELLNNRRIPIITTLHIVTTNRSVLEKYLDHLKVFGPLIEVSLIRPYISEVTHGNITRYVELSNQLNLRAIQKFLKYLRDKIVKRLYPSISMEVKYINSSHGIDHYLAKWNNTKLITYVGTLEIHIHNATQEFITTLINTTVEPTLDQ